MCNSIRKHRTWLHPGAGESQSSAQGHSNMLDWLVGITEPPCHPRCLQPLGSVVLPGAGMRSGWGEPGGHFQLKGPLAVCSGASCASLTPFCAQPAAQKWAQPRDGFYKRAGKALWGAQSCLTDRRAWGSPIARWALSHFAPSGALLA